MKVLIVFFSLFVVACSGSSSESSEKCRNYATSYTSDMGITDTCTFDENTAVLSCSDDSLNSTIKSYNDTEDFVLESSYLGKVTYLSFIEISNGITLFTDNRFENGLLKSAISDPSMLFGFGSHASFQYTDYDYLNRPLSAVVTTNIGIYCPEQRFTMEYLEQDKILKTKFESTDTCHTFSGQETSYDDDGNIVKVSNFSSSVEYTINNTESICI